MERQKAILGKKGKSRAQAAPPGEFIALGKSAPPERSEIKRPSSPQPVARKLIGAGAKRDASALGASGLVAKKPKVSQTFTPLGRSAMEPERRGSPGPAFSQAQVQLMAFEEAAIDVEPSELLSKVQLAAKDGDEETIEGLLCGAVKHLRNNRSKPDHTIFLSLMYLAKAQPSFFLSDMATEAFCSVLKRDVSFNFKAKGNALVSVLACNVLMAAFLSEDNWPDNYVKVYIDDMLGERVWVDREDCKGFVDNILTAFSTKASAKHLVVGNEATPLSALSSGGASPSQNVGEEDEASKSSDGADSEKSSASAVPGSDLPVYPRYPYQLTGIQTYVLDVVREQLVRRQTMDASCRNLIRLMTVTAGYAEVRLTSSQRLEMWLQNPKLTRTAQDLLLAVCTNCNQDDKNDQEVLQQLLKIRLKTKPLVSHFLTCIRELLGQHPENVRLVVKFTIINELTSARNPNNMSLLGIAFNHSPEVSSKVLAEVFQDLLSNKDDYLRALRGLLREVIRNTRQDIDFSVYCRSLTKERPEAKFAEMDAALKERYVLSVADLISLCMLLTITPAVREAVARNDHKDLEVLHKFRNQLAVIERDAIYWIHSILPKMMDIKAPEFVHCLRKVLFMEAPEHYYNKDNWPPDNDRAFMLRMVCEAPVLEDTLMRVMLIGLTKEMPLTANDCMDIVDQLVKRASMLYFDGMTVLQMDKLDVFNALLNLSTYHHPENIVLPKGYTPPSLAITNSYWKSWVVLLILTAFNPNTFGKEAWEKYPMLKCMMEMVMTNNYSFPPPTLATDDKMIEDIRSAERQVVQQEVQKILEFESHLAASTITQQTSHLLHQLTSLDPHGNARSPPQSVLDQLEQLNSSIKIGQMLCRSRSPDFLLDVIQRQGTSKSMPWLAELVEASEGSLDVLPVQCLCEFLLHDPRDATVSEHGDDESTKQERQRQKSRIRKHRQLLMQLQELVYSSPDNTTTMFDVLNYFLQRLAASQPASRQQAIKGLSMVIARPDSDPQEMEVEGESSASETTHDWLLKNMPSLPMFQFVKAQMCEALRQACQVETDPFLVNSYIIFLSQHAMDQSLQVLDDLALDISQLIVERNSVMNHILPDLTTERGSDYDTSLEAFLRLFYCYLSKARRQEKGEYSWSNTQDQIILQWKSGESATMHILVVHAMVIILSYGLPKDGEAQDMYRNMLEIWFPCDDSMPKAFLLDTSEEALLLPDWLKLRMIRSSEPRLVKAALFELDPRQLLLFVQSFGIPVNSMSYLLAYLDRVSESDPGHLSEMCQTMADPTYISRMINVQRLRGAMAGEKFYSLLTGGASMPNVEVKEEKMEVSKRTPDIWQVTQQTKVESPPSAAALAKEFFKMFSPETKPLDAKKLFQQILKVISSDNGKAVSLLQSIGKRLDSNQGKEFATQLINNPAKSCPFIKIFITKHASLHASLKPVLQTLHKAAGPDNTSSLVAVVSQFLTARAAQRPVSRMRQASIDLDSFKSHGQISPHAFVEGVSGITEGDRLEPLVKQYMQESLQQQNTGDAINVACNMLRNSHTQSSNTSSSSLLTDWLELLDPEIVNKKPDLQEQLVFGSDPMTPLAGAENCDKKRKGNPYLLALLTHQSQWATLNRCLDRVLQREKLTELNPTSVLDFVGACRDIPKIWQGRELKTLQNDTSEDVFDFTIEQLLAVVDFIVLEASQSHDMSHDQHTTNGHFTPGTHSQNGANQKPAKPVSHEEGGVSKRLDLLLACICENDARIRAIVSHIQSRGPLVSREEERCYLELLQELYLHFPYILAWLPADGVLSADWMVSDQIHSQLDTVAQRLIGVLGKAGPSKAVEDRMCDANIACRKLAARHPMLILRQLPLLAAVLGGRTQLTMGEMRHRNLLLMFTQILGLLELLQPHIFHRQHTSLASILQTYFTLFKSHGKEVRLLGSLVAKFMSFLQNFVTYDSQRASALLQQFVHTLTDLSLVYPDMAELKSLLTGLTLPRQNQSDSTDISGSEVPEPGSVTIKTQGGGLSYSQLEPFLNRMKAGASSEDLYGVLRDLDETSKRRVSILEHFESELKRLMSHVNDDCRHTVFTLVMRYIHYMPRKAGEFLASYLHCLQHDNPDVVITALKHLSEFTVFCQDEAPMLLQRAFDISVSTTIDASTHISDTLQLLNMESVLGSS
ncbi:integrator complex subunit 1-like isoform X2 [Littorina saxatilis]|uniref:Integrator complex subunit 1 n=1 Tax=Littorina saxatilis TaxID=31220 RepID=A0AAN9BXH1_9CAEN